MSAIAIVRMVLTTIHAAPRSETLEIYVTANITAAASAERMTVRVVFFIPEHYIRREYYLLFLSDCIIISPAYKADLQLNTQEGFL